MSIVWIDGFDLYANNAAAAQRGYNIINSPSIVTGRFSGSSALSNNNAGFNWSITATDTIAMGFAFKCVTLPGSTHCIMAFRNGSSHIDELYLLSIEGTGDCPGGLRRVSYCWVSSNHFHASGNTKEQTLKSGSLTAML